MGHISYDMTLEDLSKEGGMQELVRHLGELFGAVVEDQHVAYILAAYGRNRVQSATSSQAWGKALPEATKAQVWSDIETNCKKWYEGNGAWSANTFQEVPN